MIILAWLSVVTAAEVVVVDDNGQQIKLAVPAKRIVSLAPNITEVLFHIGAGEKNRWSG
jgi:iron complex transport system substrate-binding protein